MRQPFKFKNVLVCGGCGFIGSNFIRYFYHKHPDCKIVNLDLLTYAGNPDNLQDIEKSEDGNTESERRYHFVRGDVCNKELLEAVFLKYVPDLVLNFAAETHVDRSIVSAQDFVRTNVEGVRLLIEAARKFRTPRLVHISTDEVYGSVPSGRAAESAPMRPSNPYSASKAAGDLLVQAFMQTHKVPALILRGSNNYGPYQYPEKLIPLAITNIIEKKKVPVHGGGKHVRSWLHVLDFCAAIDLAANEAPDFEIYNVGGDEKSNNEVLELLARQTGEDINSHKEYVGDRPGADMRYAVDDSKIRSELGWLPKYTLVAAAADLVRWYADNSSWWKKIKQTPEFQNHYAKQSKAQYY